MSDGAPLRIGSSKQRALLAALLLEANQVVPSDRLIDALWGASPPSTAIHGLRTYVYRLRDALGDDGARLRTRRSGYALEIDEDELDTRCFETLLREARAAAVSDRRRLRHLEDALALWRGSPFPELADAPWAQAEVVRLEEARRVAQEERFDLKLSLGEHHEVVGELAAFVEEHPLRERGCAQQMMALYRCGRQADALDAYRSFRERLGEELGLDPPPVLQGLERQILQHDVGLRPPAVAGRGHVVPATEGTRVAGLPVAWNRLIGRDEEVARLLDAFERPGLITLVGPGGVGKSRVARQAAAQDADRYLEGVWWCELAAVERDAEAIAAVATTLQVRPGDGGSVTDAVVGYLEQRHALLVIDNAEHVLTAIAPLVRDILAGSPELRLLVTSRAPLAVPGERIHRLTPLSVEGSARNVGPAVELFLERGRAVRPDLDVEGTAELSRVVEICRRLDGLPLALELAASRLRALNPADLASRLEERLDLVSDPERDHGRHHALSATVDWSYGLLSVKEQHLFDRLSVFAGPFTIDAVEEVVVGDGIAPVEALDLLARLVDRSLVTIQAGGGPARYSLLETLRAYGRQRLDARGEQAKLHRRHAAYYVSLAEDADRQIRSGDERLGVHRLDREMENLRAAHRWIVAQIEVDLGLRLSAALFQYALWRLRAEVLAWGETIAELPGAEDHPLFPTVAGVAGWAAGLRGELDLAARWAERGRRAVSDDHPERALVPDEVRMHVALWSGHLDDCVTIADAIAEVADDGYDLMPRYVPGLALTYAGRPEEALARMDDLQASAERTGSTTMRSVVSYTRGEALLALDPPAALESLRRASELAAQVDNRLMLGVVDVSLASLEARHGDPRASLASFRGIIERLHDGGDWTHLWTGLRSLVDVLVRLGEEEDATVLLGAVREAGNAPPVYGEDAQRLEEVAQELQERLGSASFAMAYARGVGLRGGEAVELARRAISAAAPT